MGSSHGPLVLTLILDAQTQHALNALRKKWFPPNRNMLGAHVTLFHAIPPHRLAELEGHLHELCGSGEGGATGTGPGAVNGHAPHSDAITAARQEGAARGAKQTIAHTREPRAPGRAVPDGGFDVRFHNPIKMGSRGVMLNMQQKPSGTVQRLHRELLKRLKAGVKEPKDHLTNQDQMKLVHPHVTVLNKEEDPERVQACLRDLEGMQVEGRALGIEVWEYQGGPWRPMQKIMF